MTKQTLTSALFFVDNNLTVMDVNIDRGYIRFYPYRLRYYSIKKLAENYNDIIHGCEPTYYKELYS